MEIKCLKSAVMLFFKLNPVGPYLGLSNEVLCILVAQGASKLPEVKFRDTKRNMGLESGPHIPGADQAQQQNFFHTSNFDIWIYLEKRI